MSKKYNWDAVFNKARELAPTCTSQSELAKLLNVPRKTFVDAMRRHNLTLADLLVDAAGSRQASIEKLQLQNQYLQKELDALKKYMGSKQWLRDTLLEVAAMYPQEVVKSPPLSGKPESPQTAMLLLSDIHMGQLTPAEQVGLFGEYSTPIASARLRHTFQSFASIANHQPFPIEKVVIVGLGDWTDHAHLRPGHEGFVDLNAVKQILQVISIVVPNLTMLAGTFPKVEFVGVVGNHGRVTSDPRKVDPTDNFDYLTYELLKMILKDQPIKFTIPESWYAQFKVYQWNFLAVHGENIKSYVGFPWYGATRAARKYVGMFRLAQRRKIRDRKPKTSTEWEECLIVPDYALLGHFHTSTEWEAPDIEHFANGAMPGVSKYGAKDRMVISKPSQKLFFVHPRYGVGFRCPIDLDDVG